MALTALLITLALLVVGFKKAGANDRDYESSYRYAHQWAKKYRHQRDHLQALLTRRTLENRALSRRLAGAHRAVVHRVDSLEAIRLASVAYHVDFGLLYRLASCESMGEQPADPPSNSTLNRYAKNPRSTASGLFQFLTGTFAGTPYGRESIWSPYANALAAGWMIAHGRRSEWVC